MDNPIELLQRLPRLVQIDPPTPRSQSFESPLHFSLRWFYQSRIFLKVRNHSLEREPTNQSLAYLYESSIEWLNSS